MKELVEKNKENWSLRFKNYSLNFRKIPDGKKLTENRKIIFATFRPRDLSYGSKNVFKSEIISFWTFRICFNRYR